MLLWVPILCEGDVYQGVGDMMDYSEAAVSHEGGSTFQVGARQETTQPRAGSDTEEES